MPGIAFNKMDSRTKGLLWFLFQPEESGGARNMSANLHGPVNRFALMDILPEALKTALWVSVSILLSLTLAHLN